MVDQIRETLRESKVARWTALGIVSFTMMFGYFFTEVISPLKPMLEAQLGWDSTAFGTVTSAYGWFNVFLLMLIFGGIILDKMGIRFTAIGSALVMVVGAVIKFLGLYLADKLGVNASIWMASIGFAVFGVGVETAGITVSKILVKWFKGKEIALAMGLQVALARMGSFGSLFFAPYIAKAFNVAAPALLGAVLLCIGLITFFIYNFMDRKLDHQIRLELELEEPFRMKDIAMIVTNRGFWYIALLCVLFYSAVFPFYKFGPDLMVNKFGINPEHAGIIPSLVPFGTMFLTPVFGSIYDHIGKGASIMILGSVMLLCVHIVLWIPGLNSVALAVLLVIVLGMAFSLVPSAMWPSVPKIIPEKQLGTAYALIFWVQNWGLMGIPFLLGVVLDKTNPGVAAAKYAGENVNYDYSTTWLIFIVCSALSIIVAFMLKAEDKKKGYGLEQPNIVK
ncbi:MFS transporter [bacterium]|nr:MFS transporter [bacterium]MBU1065610.1 MFS transporter [bacterium]MBU1634623.1 MFS transporter [bacterium]MBU1872498.1 MFS transporter [bacterium]